MRTLMSAAVAALFAAAPAFAADPTLQEVVVSGDSGEPRVMVSDPQPTPRSSVTRSGLDLLGGPGQTSQYAPLNLMPSVVVESPDPYGLSPTRNINVRGKGDFHFARNVEGLPLTGIVGGTDLFDLENVAQVDLYRGGLQAGQGLAISNASGAVDQRLLGPGDRFGLLGKQAFGSFDFRRTFMRLDSGALGESGTRFFVSASTAAADKWKGSGGESRDNVMLGIRSQLGDRVKVDLNVVHNRFEADSNRALTYAQAQDLGSNYRFDYNTSRTGVAATDINYYRFNRVEYEDFAALANLDVTLAAGHHLVFKPYYWHNDGRQYSANGSGASAGVQIWRQQNDNTGMVLEYQGRFGTATDLVVGYWMQSMKPPPPPTDQRKFTVAADGSLVFSSWSTLSRIDNFLVNSPYAQLTGTFGKTVVSGGLRYMDLEAPRMQYYRTAGLPDASLDQIWSFNPVADPNAVVAAKHHRELLPNLGILQELSPSWSASVSYGRKFGRPDWGPQASNYISNEAAFVARGITLQSLVDRVKPELSDQIDLSMRYRNDRLTVVPTIFLARNQNRQVQAVDPALGGTLSYYEGTAKTTQYGIELEAGYEIGNAWSIFGSGSLASETYDQDTPTLSGGASLATKGKQIPNAPRTVLKGGATYRHGSLAVSPIVRYVGRRYGDSVQAQPVAGYTVVDLAAGYDFAHGIHLEVAALNLFDRRYISQISANDFSLNGSTAYYASAPRTVAVTVSARF